MITGEALRVARENEGLTQKDVAEALGVSLRSIGNWERAGMVHRKHWPALRRLFPRIDTITLTLGVEPRDKDQMIRAVRKVDGIGRPHQEKLEKDRLQRWLRSGRRPTPDLPEDAGNEDASPLERLHDLRRQLDLILRDLELDPDSSHSYPSKYREERERQLIVDLKAQVAASGSKKFSESLQSPPSNLYDFAAHPPLDTAEEHERQLGESRGEESQEHPEDWE